MSKFGDFLTGAAAVSGCIIMAMGEAMAEDQIVKDEIERYRRNAQDKRYRWSGNMTEDEYIVEQLVREKLEKEGRIRTRTY